MVTGERELFLVVGGDTGWWTGGIEDIAKRIADGRHADLSAVDKVWRLPEVWGATQGYEPVPVELVHRREDTSRDERDGAATWAHYTVTAEAGGEVVASAPYSIALDA